MDNNGIDASLGLAFSLELFKLYKRSGKLLADINRFPGIKGHNIAFLSLVEGAVVSCHIEDRGGQRYSVSMDALIRFDSEKGPLEWSFHPASPTSMPAQTSATPHSVSPRQPQPRGAVSNLPLLTDTAVPRISAPLDWKQLRMWTTRQQQILSMVWQHIDGRKNVRDIKAAIGNSLPDSVVNEALYTLFELNVIVIGM